MMLTVTESRYDVVTSADLSPRVWSAFLEDARRIVNYFEFSDKFRVRLTVSGAISCGTSLLTIPVSDKEIVLCREAGQTSIHATFKGTEDLLLRSLLTLYAHHADSLVRVDAGGSDEGWQIAYDIAREAAKLSWFDEQFIAVNKNKAPAVTKMDFDLFSSMYVSDTPKGFGISGLGFSGEKNWFF